MTAVVPDFPATVVGAARVDGGVEVARGPGAAAAYAIGVVVGVDVPAPTLAAADVGDDAVAIDTRSDAKTSQPHRRERSAGNRTRPSFPVGQRSLPDRSTKCVSHTNVSSDIVPSRQP